MGTIATTFLTPRAAVALVAANTRYWTTVAPTVGVQLGRWERAAQAIPDLDLRTVALAKLRSESFNAEGTTTLATLASRRHRAGSARAIVAFQVMYDYLDGLAERPTFDDRSEGTTLFKAFTDALTAVTEPQDYYPSCPEADGGYLEQLTGTVRETLLQLPAKDAILPAARRAAARCAEAQRQVHAATGETDLQAWATACSSGSTLRWQEFLAGAVTSALSVYVLIALGSDPGMTLIDADAVDRTYLSIAAIATLLDTLIDHQHDLRAHTQWCLPCYGNDANLVADRLLPVARRAAAETKELRRPGYHLMTLIGVAAYYLSAPEASREPTRRLAMQLKEELGPLMSPILALMKAWRATNRR